MKIGITGGTGFIGRHYIKEFADKYEFKVITSQTKYEGFDSLKNVSLQNLSYSIDGYRCAFEGCEAVVHLGAKVMHDWDGDLSIAKWMQNLENDGAVLEACRQLGIKNVVYASSVAVYDNKKSEPMKEEMLDHPNSLYGLMKSTGERLAFIYNERYGMKIKCLRISKVIGFNGITHEDNSFWSQVLINCLEKKAISLWGQGKTARDIIYVKDVARAIDCAINEPEVYGVFNIGSEIMATNLDIAKTYCEIFDNEKGMRFVPNTEEPGLQNRLDCHKAREMLGFSAQYNLFDMVDDIKQDVLELEYGYKVHE